MCVVEIGVVGCDVVGVVVVVRGCVVAEDIDGGDVIGGVGVCVDVGIGIVGVGRLCVGVKDVVDVGEVGVADVGGVIVGSISGDVDVVDDGVDVADCVGVVSYGGCVVCDGVTDVIGGSGSGGVDGVGVGGV